MHRLTSERSSRAAALAVALVLAATALAPLSALSRGARAEGGPAAVAMVHSPEVAVRTAAGDGVTATLRGVSGTLATAEGVADAGGRVVLAFHDGGEPVPVLPGTGLAVFVEGARLVAGDAPVLAVALDAARHALVGRAPAESNVAIEARGPDGSRIASGIVRTGSDGRFRSTLPASITALPGTVATATWPVDAPLVFRARWDAPHGRSILGENRVRITAPLGEVPALYVVRGRDALAAVTGTRMMGPPPASADLVVVGPGAEAVPILPGDQLTLRLGSTTAAAARAPRISARMDPLLDRVSGRIDQAGPIEVVAGGVRRTLVVDPAGTFEVWFDGAIDLRAEDAAWVSTGGALSFASPAVAEGLTVTLGSDRIDGRAPPGWVVAATLRAEAAGGRPAGSATASAGEDGALSMRFVDGDDRPVAAAPRQRLIVAWEAAPSIEVSLPEITALVDAASGIVRGQALPSAAVRVEARRGTAHAVVAVRADAQGAFTAAMGIDLGPGAWGRVIARWDDRLSIARPWAIARIGVDASAGRVAGAGGPGQEVRLTALRKGVRIGAAAGVVGAPTEAWADVLPCAPCDWSLALRDGAFGAPLQRGDVLEAALDGALVHAEVPSLEVEVNPWTDIVTGRAVPGWPLALRFERDGATSATIALRADPFGAFRARVSDTWDATGGDRVHLLVDLGPFAFVADADVGVLDIDLDRGTIEGLAAPGATVNAGVYPGTAAPRGTGSTSAAADGRFALAARDERGEAIVPRPGDTVVVQFATSVVAFELPQLGFALSGPEDAGWIEGERIAGTASPGGQLRVLATRPFGDHGARAVGLAERADDGGWSFDFGGRIDVAAGTRVEATWSTPDGRSARRAVRLPLVTAQIGGIRLSGFAAPGARVALSVEQAGRSRAEVAAMADAEGRFQADVPGGAAAMLSAGASVAAAWRGGEGPLGDGDVAMAVAGVDVEIDGAARAVAGQAPPGDAVALRAFGPGVASGLPLIATVAGATGAFSAALPGEGALPPGAAVESAHADRVGHRTVALARLPRYTLVMGERTVTAEVGPFAQVSATLAEAGMIIGAHEARADTDGNVALDLVPGSVRAGLAFRAVAGSATTAFTVPILSATIDRDGRRVHGTAVAGSFVTVRLEALGAPPALHVASADRDGQWSVAESELPAGLTVDRLRLVEARSDASGHAVLARTAPPVTPGPATTPTATANPTASPVVPEPTGDPDLTPSPAPAGGRIYLPLATGGRP